MIEIFKKLFIKRTLTNIEDIVKNPTVLKHTIRQNRDILKTVENWLTVENWKNSYYGYGVPNHIYPLLNLDIGEQVTYSDLLIYFSRLLKQLNYLELGVSVGKNFLQIAHSTTNANLTGFDIENINPALSNHFSYVSDFTWETASQSLRDESSYLKSYKLKSNDLNYLAGDIWDENSWKVLEGNKFNVIFSDALHDPEAILWEYQMIKKYNLLANDFLLLWDDLNHGLEKSFGIICMDLLKNKKIVKSNIHLLKVNGWVGSNELQKHDIGIVSTLPLS